MFNSRIIKLIKEASSISHKIEEKEKKYRNLPSRCRYCYELPYCDLDFCLRWYH